MRIRSVLYRSTEAALLAAPLPFVVVHLGALWSKDWYRFYPLLLAAAAYLLFRRYSRYVTGSVPHRSRLAHTTTAAGVMLLVTAVFLASPWLGTVAFLLLVAAIGFRFVGAAFRRHFLPVWTLLWLLVPPPLELDEYLVVRFHRWVLRSADVVLDQLGYLHWLTGNVLHMADRQFLLDIRFLRFASVFAVIAGAAWFAVWRRRSLVPALLSAVLAPFWLAVSETLGILAIPAAFQAWGIDLSVYPYAALRDGAVVFFTMVLVYSADQLLRPLAMTTSAISAIPSVFVGLIQRSGRVFRRKGKRRHPTRTSDRKAANAPTRVIRELPDGPTRIGVWFGPLTLALCVALMGLQLAVIIGHFGQRPTGDHVDARLERIEPALPTNLYGWRRIAGPAQEPRVDLQVNPRIRQWYYASRNSQAVVAMQPVANHDHGLVDHVERQGWYFYRCHERSLLDSREIRQLPQAEMELVNRTGEAGLWSFVIVDQRGAMRSPLSAAIRARWESTPLCTTLEHWKIIPAQGSRDSFGLHLFVMSQERLPTLERNAARAAFWELQRVIRNCWEHG